MLQGMVVRMNSPNMNFQALLACLDLTGSTTSMTHPQLQCLLARMPRCCLANAKPQLGP